MILSHVALSGFRGFKRPIKIEFSPAYTVIDGRNGAGKSTICDAVEFALTGNISKYLDASSARESVTDYIWWCGDSDEKVDRYVEVGFRNDSSTHCIKRTPFGATDIEMSDLIVKLVDVESAPPGALEQVCNATIIRDEHIARLSLDLKDVERYSLLREAIGASDSDQWIRRSSALLSMASEKLKAATQELDRANFEVRNSVVELDRVRTRLSESPALGNAVSSLRELLGSTASVEKIGDLGRRRLAEIGSVLDLLQSLLKDWPNIERVRSEISTSDTEVETLRSALAKSEGELETHFEELRSRPPSSALSQQARQLQQLVTLGKDIGLLEEHCPLCNSAIDAGRYEQGLDVALKIARGLDEQAVEQVTRERARDEAAERVAKAKEALEASVSRRESLLSQIRAFDERLEAVDLSGSSSAQVSDRIEALTDEREAISSHIRLLDTMALNQLLTATQRKVEHGKSRVEDAERRRGRARLAEQRAKSIHNAVRRAAGETLDERLDRVLPLMSELYKRLRPHPVWKDIEYNVRGDVRRFLKLQVGDGINPQFVFSSGQRRATGLAFLLSVNLSIAWSRWKTLVLDDPVQHVDDFRAVHLAEVLAHLRDTGRQIVCAVEDNALADLMCRRLAGSKMSTGKRISLGNAPEGELAILDDREVAPLISHSLVQPEQSLTG